MFREVSLRVMNLVCGEMELLADEMELLAGEMELLAGEMDPDHAGRSA